MCVSSESRIDADFTDFADFWGLLCIQCPLLGIEFPIHCSQGIRCRYKTETPPQKPAGIQYVKRGIARWLAHTLSQMRLRSRIAGNGQGLHHYQRQWMFSMNHRHRFDYQRYRKPHTRRSTPGVYRSGYLLTSL